MEKQTEWGKRAKENNNKKKMNNRRSNSNEPASLQVEYKKITLWGSRTRASRGIPSQDGGTDR